MLTDEGDISNYLGVDIKNNSDGTSILLKSQLVEKKNMSDLQCAQVLSA